MPANLLSSAREREVLAAVADGIITAAAGAALRVVVTCSPSHLPFAGQLTKALHARGRACRCLVPSPDGPPSDDAEAIRQAAAGQAIAMIVEGTPTSGGEVCRISIRISHDSREASPSPTSSEQADGSGRDPDVIVDYSDPDGPTILQFSVRLALSTDSPVEVTMNGGE
ncbi:hypothetical protein [Micromonospora sp. NPDC005299]|uniref:hypothetical protein n=1 Tax=Micromonospora sp. NPDC005299 TaxID=3364231 RepID=UPI00367CA16D